MTLTEKQKSAVSTWMKERRVNPACPACAKTDGWQLHDQIISGLDLDLENKKATPSKAGFFAFACKNCRYVMFFAAAPILGGGADTA